MRLAAVDIGSNAVRLQITNVIEYEGTVTLKKIEYIRYPLRLGHDVFAHKNISRPTIDQFIKLIKSFSLLIDLWQVKDTLVYATSAMREAQNAKEVIAEIHKKTGLKIEVISGDKEASMITRAIETYLDESTWLHIDVGGGSTELNLYRNKEMIASRSFEIGSVRRLEHYESPEVVEDMHKWIKQYIVKETVTALGTGGNISKILELASVRTGKNKTLSLAKVEETYKYLASFTLDERINKLQLNPDRADVILPAAEIYVSVMKWGHIRKIFIPDSGLKDGMMQIMYERQIAAAEKATSPN